MAKIRNYTDKDIIENSKKVKSMAGLLRSLGLKPIGGNYANMKRNLKRLNLKCEHWKGQGWNKGEQLKDWNDYIKIRNVKKHLLKLRGNQCECCKSKTWMDKPITIEIHHINGDRTNNNPDNLKLLCPNCHSYTDNWRK